MTRVPKSLVRRVEVLESMARKAAPAERNLLLEMSITAMAQAWTAEEVEQMLAAAEGSQLAELPAGLRSAWVRDLDCISLKRFGKTFGALLACPLGDTEPPSSAAANQTTATPGKDHNVSKVR